MLGIGILSLASCEDAMEEIKSVEYNRTFSPLKFDAKNVSKESVELEWLSSEGATSYVIEIFEDDSLTFEGNAKYKFEGLSIDDIPYEVTGLVYDTKYSARVMAIDEKDKNRNSKWSEVYFRTNAQQIFKDIPNSSIADRSVVLNWPAGEEVSTILVKYTNDNGVTTTVTTHQITEEEKASGEATIDNLEPSTKYDVTLYNGDKRRGSKSFTTIADLAGATVVRATDDLNTMLSEATENQVFALMPGTFFIPGDESGAGSVAISKSVVIKGVYPTDLPVIKGRFEIKEGASMEIDNIILDGIDNETSDQAFNFKTANVTYAKFIVSNSEIRNFGKGIFYLNVEATVGELTFRSCLIHNIECDGGDMFDSRKGRIDSFNLIGSTLYESCSGRDMIRMDDASKALGGTPIITVDKCTINGISNNSSKRLLYVRYKGNVINWTNTIVSNTAGIWSNQANTAEPSFANNNYFNASNLNVVIEGGNKYADTKGSNFDPEYTDIAKGNFTIGNANVSKLKTGDPRWFE